MTNMIFPRLLVERIGDVTVVGFVDRVIVSEDAIREIVEHLGDLSEGSDPGKLLLNFRGVDTVSARMYSVLFWAARRVARSGGTMKLCGLAPHLLNHFEITRLHRYFEIYSAESHAIASFPSFSPSLCTP